MGEALQVFEHRNLEFGTETRNYYELVIQDIIYHLFPQRRSSDRKDTFSEACKSTTILRSVSLSSVLMGSPSTSINSIYLGTIRGCLKKRSSSSWNSHCHGNAKGNYLTNYLTLQPIASTNSRISVSVSKLLRNFSTCRIMENTKTEKNHAASYPYQWRAKGHNSPQTPQKRTQNSI